MCWICGLWRSRLPIDDMQKVSSAYTKDANQAYFVGHSEVLYADKKEPSARFVP